MRQSIFCESELTAGPSGPRDMGPIAPSDFGRFRSKTCSIKMPLSLLLIGVPPTHQIFRPSYSPNNASMSLFLWIDLECFEETIWALKYEIMKISLNKSMILVYIFDVKLLRPFRVWNRVYCANYFETFWFFYKFWRNRENSYRKIIL